MIDAIGIRPFEEHDRSSLEEIRRTANPDLWKAQFQALHGHPNATTMVAVLEGSIIGAGSTAESRLHPTRRSIAIDVLPAYRRRGIGSALLMALRHVHSDDPKPFATKVFEHMEAGYMFARHHGAEPYQVVPGFNIRPVRLQKALDRPDQVPVESMSNIGAAQRIDKFCQMYEWTHAAWSPISSRAVMHDISLEIVNECDPELSFMAIAEDGATFLTFAFCEGDAIEVVSESLDGRAVAAEVARSSYWHLARAAAARNAERLWFDSHVSDPNVHPVLAEIDELDTERLYLMSLPG